MTGEAGVEARPFSQTVTAIYVAEQKGSPMQGVAAVVAVEGEGLAGDRYPNGGSWSKDTREGTFPAENRQVTFISTDGIDQGNAALRELGIETFTPGQTRRNVLVDLRLDELNGLVGRRFKVGNAEFLGVELCEPCKRPAQLVGRDREGREAFEESFKGRAGIRARVVKSGDFQVGDMLTVPFRSQTFDESPLADDSDEGRDIRELWPTRAAGSNRRVV